MSFDWLDQAACLGTTPEYWFPEKGGSDTIESAQAICATCPVTAQCLELALLGGRRYSEGVYAGLTAKERRDIKRGKRNEDLRQESEPSSSLSRQDRAS